MPRRITISEYLKYTEQRVLLDVRTPAEFEQAHIPRALNLPLFSNEERAIVGTIYKKESPEQAFLHGLDFAGAKMSNYVKTAMTKAPHRKIGVYCWRGGKRSGSLGWLLEFAGFDTVTIEGGYKAYRKYVRERFDWAAYNFIVLGGESGSGKTAILHELQQQGEQIIDLEGLANHRGSTFGMLGQAPQPTTEYFDNLLHHQLGQLDSTKRIWIENESRCIGQVYLLDGFWEVFKQSPLLQLQVPKANRIERLVADYAQFPKQHLIEAFQRIEKRLGGQHLKTALSALAMDDFETAAAIGLQYYDKSYTKSTATAEFAPIYNFPTSCKDMDQIAASIIQFANDNNL